MAILETKSDNVTKYRYPSGGYNSASSVSFKQMDKRFNYVAPRPANRYERHTIVVLYILLHGIIMLFASSLI